MSDADADKLVALSDTLFKNKQPWDQLCQDIAENFYPVRATFTASAPLGSDFAGTIMDGHTLNVREELGNAMFSMLRQGKWFELGTGDEDRDKASMNARALERGTSVLTSIIKDPRSNFAAATKEGDHDWVAFGQPVLSVEENMDRTFPKVRAWHPSTCAWLENNDHEIDANHRRFELEARNVEALVKRGRWKGLHPDIAMACEKEPGKKFKFLHVLMPTEDMYGFDGKEMRRINAPYFSAYIDVEHREFMQRGGEPFFPFVHPRWRRLSGFPYGFSPAAMNSLPDARMLQDMARVILEQGEKAVDPPMVAAAELFSRDINLFAGGLTEADLPDGAKLEDVMSTIDTGRGITLGFELKQDVRALITEAWLLNKLFLPSAREMREIEVMVRTDEFRRAALPFFAPVEEEYHTPLLGKVFDRAVQMKLMPMGIFPEQLQGQDIRFTFHTPLNEAEGKKTMEAFRLSMEIAAQGATVDGTVANILNVRQAATDAIQGTGAPADWIYSDGEQRKRKDQEAEKATALKEAAAMANMGATAASNVAVAKQNADAAGLT
jgi:hypothetical protein